LFLIYYFFLFSLFYLFPFQYSLIYRKLYNLRRLSLSILYRLSRRGVTICYFLVFQIVNRTEDFRFKEIEEIDIEVFLQDKCLKKEDLFADREIGAGNLLKELIELEENSYCIIE